MLRLGVVLFAARSLRDDKWFYFFRFPVSVFGEVLHYVQDDNASWVLGSGAGKVTRRRVLNCIAGTLLTFLACNT